MGVIPIIENERHKLPDESTVIFNADTTTADMSYPEDGTVSVSIEIADGREAGDFGAHVPYSGFTDRWWRDFVTAFLAFPAVRQSWYIHEETGMSEVGEGIDSGKMPSLPALPDPGRKAAVTRLMQLGNRASFKDFAALRSGRDEWSSRSGFQLRVSVLKTEVMDLEQVIQSRHPELPEAEIDKALRWIGRGLSADLALRKVLTDLEVASNVKRR